MEQVTSGGLSVSSAENEETTPIFTLEDLKNMFKTSIESEVVEMIWHNSDENSEVALSFLTEMCPAKPPELSSPASQSNNTWTSIVLAKPPKDVPVAPSVRPKFKPTQRKLSKCGIVDTIKNRVKKRERILIIMRGVPGSGKSTLARKMQGSGVVLSTDDFFVNKFGEYYFNPHSLSEAHSWNQRRADREMKASTNPIIIDNTNLEAWEMQPYVFMALRYKYSIELIEPDTPWKNDPRTLSQKNTHGVPRWKIEQMLEKQSVSIDLAAVIESCRQKLSSPAMPFQEASPHAIETSADLIHCEETISLSVISSASKSSSTPIGALPLPSSSSSVSSLTSEENLFVVSPVTQTADCDGYEVSAQEETEFKKEENAGLPVMEGATIIQALRPEKLLAEKVPGSASDPVHSKKKALAVLKSYFPALDTKDLADILGQCKDDVTWAINVLLDSGYECADVVIDTSDLLEDEYKEEATEEKPVEHSAAINMTETIESSSEVVEQNESAIAEASVLQAENTEALRRHIEECFQLTDTISEHTRRVCGKDYNQFKAFQLQKLRQGQSISEFQLDPTGGHGSEYAVPPSETVAPLGEAAIPPQQEHQPGYLQYNIGGTAYFNDFRSLEEYQTPQLSNGQLVEEEAMVPITVDPSFIQQLVSFFGPLASPAKNPEIDSQKSPVTFDIPWSLAEQLYLSWCSSMVKDTTEEVQSAVTCVGENEGGEFNNIMDIEYAMKLIEEEKNAELRQLRESLSTKISRKMLTESFPQVDPLALEALFEANNYNYGQTVAALNASLGTTPKIKEPEEVKSPSKPKPKPKSTTEEVGENQGYSDIRSEAFMYDRLRQQYSAKARENHQRGMTAVAAYYASESRRYAELFKECNQKAALHIVEKKNAKQDERTLDLHELHVVEALSCLESFIASNLKEGRTVVHVITGRGNNSVNGRARIKPAVVTFLNQKKYAFEELNPGMLRVFIRRN